MSTATLEGRRVSRLRLVLPYSGLWHADVSIDVADVLSGAITLVLGGLTLAGFVVFGDAYQGAARYTVIGGKGGWRKALPAKAYRLPAGIPLSLVVGDAATEAGESVVVAAAAERTLGPAYTRAAAPAVRTLSLLASTWWADAAGVTHVGTRPSGTISTVTDVIDYRPEDRVAVVASETPEVFEPGKTIALTGAPSLVIADVVHTLSATELRTELWGV